MNPRTRLLAGLAALGLAAALVFTFTGGAPEVVQPRRTASGGAGGGSPAPGASPAAGGNPRAGYEAFRLFHTRNVFDPDRRPPRAVAAETPAPPPPAPARTDFVALTGVLLRADRSLAFFSGSRAEYNKVLAVSDRIAGAEITQILPAGVEIARAGQKTQVAVGQTVPLVNGAAPAAAPAPEAYASAPSTASSAAVGSTAPGNNGAASASPGAASSSKQEEIRRRLEERRRQEQK